MSIGHSRHEEFGRSDDAFDPEFGVHGPRTNGPCAGGDGSQAAGSDVLSFAGDVVNERFVQARLRIPALAVLPSASVPAFDTLCSLEPIAALVGTLETTDWSIEGLVRAIGALDRELGPLPDAVPLDVAEMLEKGVRAEFSSHDYFFHVNRAPEASALLFARSTLQAILHLRLDVSEAPASLTDAELAELELALRRVLVPQSDMAAADVRFARAVGVVRDDFIQARWIRGHQVFAALTQGLISAFIALDAAVASDAWDEAFVAADLVAALFRGSDLSLRHTGDFPPFLYDRVVKPAMEPPFLPEGFSGLLSADHHHLVRLMREGRGLLDLLKVKSPERHAAIGTTLAGVYDSHKMVCGKFAGTERGSLLLASPCKRAAVDQIDAFKKTRLRTSGFADEAVAR